ncbi:non-ribosomal peptide synthetase/type I polyketide synthase [Chitinophaga sp. HK235]|uniref:non-ribosomal peptide synthetase/type I polyketide synthase n=1 Tax=Chitinophaga sp. HK235 TaxID=2952571 RepID=UPI001BA99392|nr:non-ribosomal peptide synthetase/type I polyketide synthase [Chitinophaga sp. HK235]
MTNASFPQTTLSALLIAQKDNLDKGVTFISGASKEEFLSYHQLYVSARSLLAYLQEKGVKPGNEVVLQIEDNKTFIQFFWACILGGIIPVPVAVTYQGENAQKLFRIWQLLHHPYLLTSRASYEKMHHKKSPGEIPFADSTLFTEDAQISDVSGIVYPATTDDIAFIQFSSGSTGNPKGVVLKHSNLIANIFSALPTHDNITDRRLSWMPLTHDLGLIFFHLYPIANGAQHFLMPTDLFIRHPLLWLQKVSEHRATITGSPNFGYKYYLDKFSDDKAEGLDLSCLQVIINGAEPISGTLCRTFLDTLSKYGLVPTAMRPAYGLAESTLIVTFAPADTLLESVFVRREAITIGRYISEPGMLEQQRTADNMEIVNVGRLIANTDIKITDEKGEILQEGGIGIIWVYGPSVTQMYYNNEAATHAVIKEGWLNTGDTGFMLNGYLYAVGRVKDIIIVNGQNVYPHDIEQMLETMDDIETGKVLACGVPNEDESSEDIVIFVMYKLSIEKFAPLARSIKRFVAARLGLEVKHVLPVRKIAKTTSGKVKRYLFSDEYRQGVYDKDIAAIAAASDNKTIAVITDQELHERETKIGTWLENWLKQHLQLSAAELVQARTFTEYGITSMQAVALANDLEDFLQTPVDNTVIYSYPNVGSLATHFSGRTPQVKEEEKKVAEIEEKVAVIGIGCRFPGNVSSPEDFWQLLISEKNAITQVPSDRWDMDAYYDTATGMRGKMYTREGGFIKDVDKFDPLFFGISPKEAAAMDPQQRLLLEVCWEALEHAGLRPSSLRGSDSGVFIGMGADDYQQLIRANNDATYFEDAFTGLGTERSIAAGRVAYLLDFHGPVIQLDTACSSSLVSIHQACKSLLHDNCSLALAGGVNLMLSPDSTVKLCQMNALSPTGACRTFDDNADGYVRGEGAGIVVLKRLSDALADGDNVLAVISGSAVNHDGLSNGISAPNGVAQQQLLHKALQNAGIAPEAVQYIEAHGTGTRLGDPVEVQALNAVYGGTRTATELLMLGAVKSNIGHLEAAAGVTGLIKVILCLQHRKIPATLHYQTPNRFIPWNNMAVRVVNALTPWQPVNGKRYGAVSAFGLSGTNAHVILEEAVPAKDHTVPAAAKPAYPVVLSAKTPAALKELAASYAGLLGDPALALSDLSYSSAMSRDSFPHRIAFHVGNNTAAKECLDNYVSGKMTKTLLYGHAMAPEKVAWLFTGQGSQYWNMGRELYEVNEVFRKVINHCDAWLKTQWDISLITLLYENDREAGNALLRETQFTQPALFALGCALAEVWKSWGVTPAIVVGHSVGEYAAAYAAGVFSLDDGLKLITERARLMQAVSTPGAMAMIFAPENEVKEAIQPYGAALSIAAINGPALTVISGEKEAVAEVVAALKQKGISHRELTVSHAFHSRLMEPVIAAFRQVAENIRFHMPAIPLVSNVTGNIIREEITTAAYWCNHILEPVQFSKSMKAIKEFGADIFLEVGPQPHLLSMAQLTVPADEGRLLPSMRESQSAWNTMLHSLLALYTKGIPVNWSGFFDQGHYHKIQLPVYPFQRQRYWIKENEIKTIPVTTTPAVNMSLNHHTAAPVAGSQTAITTFLVDMLGELLKIAPADINVDTPLLLLGADSLVLASMVKRIESEYGLSISMRLLFEKMDTVTLIADYIAAHAVITTPAPLPAASPVVTREVPSITPETPLLPPVNGKTAGIASETLQLLQSQVNVMAQQLQLLMMQQQLSGNVPVTVTPEPVPMLPAPVEAPHSKYVNGRQGKMNGQLTDQIPASEVRREEALVAGIGRQPVPANIPLSFNQERLWFVDQLEGSVQYNLPAVLRLKGNLDNAALLHALQKIVGRHEVLRTVIEQADGQPYQRILDNYEWQMATIDDPLLKADPARLQAFISDFVYTPFDLAKDNLLRAALIRITDMEYVLVLAVHHIVFDGWSAGVLFNELAILYTAYRENHTAALPSLNIQYKDYAIWQRHYLKDALLQEKEAYWKNRLKGATPLLLPTDFERPVNRSTRGAATEMRIDKTLSARIRQLSRQQGVTLFTTLLTAYKVLLSRYSGLEDIVVACAIAGRTEREVEPLLGFFANTLVLRSDLSGRPSFSELLKKVSSTVLDAHEYQDVPFNKVTEAAADKGSRGDNPLLHVMFTVQNIPNAADIRLGDVQVAYEPVVRQTSIADITLATQDLPDGISLMVEYSTDLFREATIRQMMQHYEAILSEVVNQPTLPLHKIKLLSETEQKQQLHSFNATHHDYPAYKTVVELFESQVLATPDAVAVSFNGKQLSYHSLNEQANQVAHYLLAEGIRPGDKVGLLSYRGLDMIVAIWGVLKAGAAYVPFHTGYPGARIRMMMEDAGIAKVLFTDNTLFEAMGLSAAEGIDITGAKGFTTAATGIKTNHDALVNIMYTSGTTGRPKGIAVNHKNITKLVFEPGVIAIQPNDQVLQWSNYAFDGSTYDIFNTLLRGARLCMIRDAAASDALELSSIIRKEQITVCFMTTALFNSFVDSSIEGLRPLRKVLFGGEKVSVYHVKKALAAYGPGKLVHVYGPTETTVYATSYPIDSLDTHAVTVPIGRPLANTKALILDQNGELVPVGVDGELYIGGDGVSAGYINNEQLTLEKFVVLKGQDGRWYRTGDLCRWSPEGSIIYTSRADDQVKIRGYRIEPGEIERAMNSLDGIAASSVVVKQSPTGEKKLVGYYVVNTALGAISEKDIRQSLQKQLPEYMMPSALIALSQLPLTSNGKTDRKLLSSLEDVQDDQTISHEEPATPIERQLTAIWQRLLGVDRIGIQDNFFTLGGHSLLATRVVSAVRKELETELSVKDLFDHPTVEKLATWLQQQQKGGLLPSVTVAIRPEHIPLSYSQERLWFIDQLEGSVQYHMPATFSLKGALNTTALEYAWRNIVNRHEVLRTVFIQEGESAYQHVLEKNQWQLSVIDKSVYEEDPQVFINGLITVPFDLSKDHMLRVYLVPLAPEEHVMVLMMHHIASDGWSLSVMVKELLELYNAYIAKREPVLEVLPIQYADYAIWQRDYLNSELLGRKVDYWRNQLKDIPALKLPTDFERPVINSTRGDLITFRIDRTLTRQLETLAQQQESTLYMLLLAAFKVLLYRYTGQEDIAVGSGIAGRLQQETESLIGFFVNTLVMRSDLGGNPAFDSFLQQVRQTTLDAYEHQEVPFERVVEAVVGARDVSQNPLFQVMFALQNIPDIPELRLGEVMLKRQRINHTTSLFDLFWSISVQPYGTVVELEYCIDLFTERTIRKMMDHYVALLRAIVQNPALPISELNMLGKVEEDQLLSFSGIAASYPADKTIVELFEEQARLTPDATALVFETQKLSYRMLDKVSSQLAHLLISNGVKENTMVPVCLGRSAELIISILAILKAGAAYVPVDATYPAERITYMLEDIAGKLVITTAANEALLRAAAPAATFICLDNLSELVTGQPDGQLKISTGPDSLAYVIYTSGSTGRPKGAMVTHRNVTSLVKGAGFVSMTNDDVLLSTGSPSFDATTFEYWSMLLNGGQLVLCPEKHLLDNRLLRQEMQSRKVTMMWFTASWFNQLIDDDINIFEGLNVVLAGGEKLSEIHVQKFLAAHPHITVINGYGPTENTTFSLTYPLAAISAGVSIPIGRPLANRQAYVLDSRQRLVPVGVPGELYVGGAGVSLGYLNQPALTQEKFIADPFSTTPGARLYRTGDKARWLADGTVEYLGRIDDQVKIRGFRIEPGEIERTLNELDTIANSCVVVKQQPSGDKRLAAYYVPEPAQVLLKEQQLFEHQVANWKELYEMAFSKPEDIVIADPEFDITGWNDSFTGGAIPADQMRKWLNDIAGVILGLKPERVLEIGCGTGLIYYQLADHISKYIGTDFSPVSTGQLQQHVNKQLRRYPDTELNVCAAHEVALPASETIDLVVLNSIIQYFPGAGYMSDVLAKAIRLLKGKGHIVIGDVRDLRLLPSFKRRLQLDRMQDSTAVKDFIWHADQEVLKEEELCFSPAYFYQLRAQYPEITHVEILWKQGDFINELSLYRYTVIVHVGTEKETWEPRWQPWNSAAVQEQLDNNTATIALKDVPNPRLWKERMLAQALDDKSALQVRDLVNAMAAPDAETIAVNAVLSAAKSKGYHCRFLLHDDPMKMNVLLERTPYTGFIAQPYNDARETVKANIPLFGDICTILQKEIQQLLKKRLPEYMVPSAFFALQYLPLTTNGKTDRKFLSEWEDMEQKHQGGYQAPVTPEETALVAIWQRLLGVERVGVTDNFFELGGHSLLATRVVSAIRKQLQADLTVKDFFLYPTIAQLAAHLQNKEEGSLLPPITAVSRPSHIPLSFGQERLWFIDRLQGSKQYHMVATLRLKGNLNATALESALQMIVSRHEALRTVIKINGITGVAGQHILNKDRWQLHTMETPVALQESITALIGQPFDLSADYMMRAHLIRLDATEHVLALIIHHIASDGWSVGNLIKELVTLYHSYAADISVQLKPLPLQYADYALWQRKYITGSLLDKQLAYWKEQLAGSGELSLPTDYERPPVLSTRGATVEFNIDKLLVEKLNNLSQQQGATLFMTLLAVFKVMLCRYGGQEDISIGSGVAGRTQEETEEMIGFFVNTLVMRSHLKGDMPFHLFLQQVKETTLNAYMNQDVSFEKVVEAVLDKRDLSINPLFQVVFMLQNTPKMPALDLAGVVISEEPYTASTSLFDMSFFVKEGEDGLQIDVEYCIDLFKRETILRLLNYYHHLLEAVANAPEQPLSELDMLGQEERHQLLVTFNDKRRDYSADAHKTIVDIFEEQVALAPNAAALVFGDTEITYQELNERVNQLAHYLRVEGVTTEKLVPVFLERSPEMIIAILAILKAGGAYVPVDTEYPQERIAYILEDTSASIIITSRNCRNGLPLNDKRSIIEVDVMADQLQRMPVSLLRNSAVTAGHLAYLIYTSGSTGTPKGVMVEHGSVVNLTRAMKEELRLQPGMKTLQFASVGFDAACYEIFNTLLSGGCLVLAEKETLLSGAMLEALVNRHTISVAVLPPSYLNAMKDSLGCLHTIVSAGEPLSRSLALYIQSKGIRLINAYGPTEGTVCASLTDRPVLDDNMVVIGKPVANVPLYVLDEGNDLVPLGGVGELCIGGVQVARGYLNRTTLTNERFITNPFGEGRLYKTGDMVRWLPDGNLVYLGRRDEQVKIRGHRIELGEIENVLEEHEKISKAVVLVKADDNGNKQLIGYVLSNDTINKENIFHFLRGRLPDYMVPAQLIELLSLPTTSSGKVDKKALLDAVKEVQVTNTTQEAPRNETERHLVTIWQELLGVSAIGVHNNFFELGGDSIITIQVVNRAKHYGYVLQPRDLFMHQTIAELATLLAGQEVKRITGEQGYLSGECGLLPVQQWYLSDDSNVSDHFIQSLPVEINKAIDVEILSAAITHLISFHDSLRFAYSNSSGQWQQWYGNDNGTIEVVDLRSTSEDNLAAEIIFWEDKYKHSLSMKDGKLVCAVLFLTPEKIPSNRLLVAIHHLGVDVVSWRILFDDLDRLLGDLLAGKEVSMVSKSSSYREWYNALQHYGQTECLLSQRDYWQQATDQYHPLPTDKHYEGLVRINEMTAYRVRLNVSLTRKLLHEVAQAYQTEVKDLLLSALALTLSEWMDSSRVSIGFEKHGREDISPDIDISHTTGWFTTLSPVSLDASAGEDTGALISTIKKQLNEVPDKGLGFGVLKYINKEAGLQGKDPWDIIFNYHGQIDNVSSNHKWIALTGTSSELKLIGSYTMRFKLFIDSVVTDDELVIDWLYSTHHFQQSTIKALGTAYIRHLETLIHHCMMQLGKQQLYQV